MDAMVTNTKSLLFDIQHAITGIDSFTTGRSHDDFTEDLMLRRAVERQLGIICVAMTRLKKINAAVTESILASREIINFRDVLIHGYDTINDDVTWRIVSEKLPLIRRDIDDLMKAS
jgi:uncharacterized protein with HEPN domain